MKSKLSAALAAAGYVLAVSPAIAISVTSHPGATTTSVPGAAATGNFFGAGGADPASTNVTVTLTNPVSYVGFAWGTPDQPNNQVDVYNVSTLLGSFFGNLIPGNPGYYFDIHADSGEAITKLVLSSPNLCCFETDNYSAIPSGVPGPIAGAGLPA
jgi:hypothetical protein